MTEQVSYLSLFSGIEAASSAWEPMGWEPMAFAEIEPFPSAVLAHRYPDVPNLGDVTAVDWQAWKEANGSPDVLIAGAPCQAFSVAGQRQSLEDARGNLTLFTARLVRLLGPRFFLFENVPGVLSTADNAFGCLLGELVGAGAPCIPAGGKWADAGAVVGPEGRLVWRVLDAQYFGVAQRRRRVFLVRCPLDGPDPAEVLFEPSGLQRHTPPSREPRQGAPAGARGGAQGSGGEWPADVAATLRHENGSPGYADQDLFSQQGANLVPAAPQVFKASHFTRGKDGAPSDICPPLCVEDDRGDQSPLVMASGQANAEVGDDLCPSMSARQFKDPPIVFRKSARAQTSPENGGSETWVDDGVANTLNAHDDAGDVRATHAIVLPIADQATRYAGTDGADAGKPGREGVGKGHGFGVGDDGDPMFTVTTGDKHAVAVSQEPLAIHENQRNEITLSSTAGTLHQGGGKPGTGYPAALCGMVVRRLMPLECARLQGFSDHHARIAWKGKPAEECPDGPQYKLLRQFDGGAGYPLDR